MEAEPEGTLFGYRCAPSAGHRGTARAIIDRIAGEADAVPDRHRPRHAKSLTVAARRWRMVGLASAVAVAAFTATVDIPCLVLAGSLHVVGNSSQNAVLTRDPTPNWIAQWLTPDANVACDLVFTASRAALEWPGLNSRKVSSRTPATSIDIDGSPFDSALERGELGAGCRAATNG